MSHIFFELTAVLVLATALGFAARMLRQPTILGYILAGVIAGPLGFMRLDSIEILDALSQVGIASLLFLVGMEMRAAELKSVGKTAVLTGAGQIVFTSVIGYGLVRLLGFPPISALYISVALTFSSTIIVVKLLSEKHALQSLYGRIVVGFLLLQDFVALAFLVLLSSLPPSLPAALSALPLGHIGAAFAKGVALLAAALLAGRYVMPAVLRKIAHSTELVFLTGLAWGMGLAAFAASPWMGLTIEFGSFLAGIAVAGTFERHEMSTRIRPIRDFFIVLFFVVLGSRLAVGDLAAVAWPAAALSLFVLVGNPLIVLGIMGALGHRSRVSFLASVTVAQISEFSLILVVLGRKLGHFDDDVVTLVTAVGMVTIAASSYLIIYAERIFERLKPALARFERKRVNGDEWEGAESRMDHVVLVGCHRTGLHIMEPLLKAGARVTVVDVDPDIVASLLREGRDAIYGDIDDDDIRDAAGVANARLVVSTVPDHGCNLHLLRYAKRRRSKAKLVFTAEREKDAISLYDAGADYVMLPHVSAGSLLADALSGGSSLKTLAQMRKRQLRHLSRGH